MKGFKYMRSKRGAISLFALVAMMFFLIFVMVAYNNIAEKGKNQIETTSVLVDYYKSDTTVDSIYSALVSEDSAKDKVKSTLQSQEANKSANNGKYMAINGKVYKIK